jgi:hypothetical protein
MDGDEETEIPVDRLELTALGRRVATAYDEAVGKLPAAMKLAKQPAGCRPAELKRWGAVGGLCELSDPSSPDRDLLREVFFNHVGSPGESHRLRHDSLTLLLELIRQLERHGLQLNATLFNDATYLGTVQQETDSAQVEIEWPNALKDVVERWRMFHFHSYCAVALESLFVAIVCKARATGIQGFRLETLVEGLKAKSVMEFLNKRLGRKTEKAFPDLTPRQLFSLAGLDGFGNEDETLKDPPGLSHPLCESNLDAALWGEIDRDTPEGIVCALLLLVTAVVRFVPLERSPYCTWLAGQVEDPYKDVTVPVVLRELRQQFDNFLDASWHDIALFVLRRFVVRQHEVLAYVKSWDGSRAFFHTEQDLIRWRQLNYDQIGVNNSRFPRALQILQDLGLVARDADDRAVLRLTADGETQLKRELKEMGQR